VLAGIAGPFAEEGINIVSLAVGEDEGMNTSRMTMVVECEENLLSEVVRHLDDSDDVIAVEDLEREDMIERELMLVKVRAEGEDIAKIMQLVEVFRATVVGMGRDSLVIEMTATEKRIDAMINLLRPFGITALTRTGRVAVKHREESD